MLTKIAIWVVSCAVLRVAGFSRMLCHNHAPWLRDPPSELLRHPGPRTADVMAICSSIGYCPPMLLEPTSTMAVAARLQRGTIAGN
ncbi:hypothetical protein VDS46_17890, partial [Xanthomonas campestris pv. campestris]|uniref:hypothetical protein n=1 Tax=Xanthomonas campestris TaxID=339 RepID=UPI002B3F5375|nr:hypothetical protein [Xanthomonas campestris pv. campestris]MEB1964423.1 hypothetical protein [Xanthomonas campestris pv. campestris]MEB2057990.1 hypothetical protein [Xanthomonas campestris pv. campestris]MEB2171309.1 hypothetical protein [Xanthomonas campestris pv. campestris]MEB2229246.1 hypothetical protein [Xanthomonas campestris pv. campestris]